MKERLDKVLEFLKENQKENVDLQIKYMKTTLCTKESKKDRLIALLYDTASTQSQPKMEKLAPLFKRLYQSAESFDTFYDFLIFLDKNKKINDEKPYKSLYEALKKEKGWGEKTSALFVKNLYNLHYNEDFIEAFGKDTLWQIMPELKVEDEIFLPVDAVILAVFNKLNPNLPKWTFRKINHKLKELGFSNQDIIQFDDFWFWGYITQNSKGNDSSKDMRDEKRKMGWNEDKYWMITESNKDEKYIEYIQNKSVNVFKIIQR